VVGPAKRLLPQARLVVSGGELSGQARPVDSDELVIGRRDGNDFVLNDPHVSGAHARLRRSAGSVLLEDLGSTNGTFINGQSLTGSVALRDGDLVHFGSLEVRYEDRGSGLARTERTHVLDDAAASAVAPYVPAAPAEEVPALSPRQKQVLGYLREGYTNPQIAQHMGVTERTVKAHCQEVYDRLAVPNRTAAVEAAHRLGLPERAQDAPAG